MNAGRRSPSGRNVGGWSGRGDQRMAERKSGTFFLMKRNTVVMVRSARQRLIDRKIDS